MSITFEEEYASAIKRNLNTPAPKGLIGFLIKMGAKNENQASKILLVLTLIFFTAAITIFAMFFVPDRNSPPNPIIFNTDAMIPR